MAENSENLELTGEDENLMTEFENPKISENINENVESSESNGMQSVRNETNDTCEQKNTVEMTEIENEIKAAKNDKKEEEMSSTDDEPKISEESNAIEECPVEKKFSGDDSKDTEIMEDTQKDVVESLESNESATDKESDLPEMIDFPEDTEKPEQNEETAVEMAEKLEKNLPENEEKPEINLTEMTNSEKLEIADKTAKVPEKDESVANTNTESQKDEEPTVSEDLPSKKRKISDTPEDIINLLKALSPEKLQEIKSKVLEISTDKKDEPSTSKKLEFDQKTKTDDKYSEETPTSSETATESKTKSGNDVICLDSEDEDEKQAASSEKPVEQQEVANEEASVPEQQVSEEQLHVHLNGDSSVNRGNSKECINPDCPKNKDDEYLDCPGFVMSMYYISRKPNKIQWVCTTCFNEAVVTYEQLCSKFLSNQPWTSVKIPKKQDLVEISDSEDEEDEAGCDGNKEVDSSNMIVFDEEVEKEVNEILTNLTKKIDLKMQLDEEFKVIESMVDKNDKLLSEMNADITQLERKSYKMYDELYSFNRPRIQRKPSISIESDLSHPTTSSIARSVASILEKTNSEISITPVNRSTPMPATQTALQKALAAQLEPQPQDRICYAIRQRGVSMPHWLPCRILEEVSTSIQDSKKYKVQFCDNLPASLTFVSGREISEPVFSEKLEIGARVIALFPRSQQPRKHNAPLPKRFLPGVIGERLTQYNKRRYLIFCDYGQVRYCAPNEVRAIKESSENVWDDVHPNLRQFIRDYLESKTNRSRALLNVRVNTQILTERGGNWRKTIVQEVDSSLVKVYFTTEHVSEWLYRGSKRLYTMYQQTQRIQSNTFQRRTDPGTFSYITIDEDDSNSAESAGNEIKKNIAKKSTSKPQPVPQATTTPQQQLPSAQQPIILNDRNIYLDDPTIIAKVRHFTPKAGICSKKYQPHECLNTCIPSSKNDLSSFSPLSKPLLSCWERQIVKQKNFRFVIYKAPCGRRLRNMNEVFIYLNMTKCVLNVDNFDFDPSIQVLASYHVDKSLCPLFIDDIAQGKEGMKISCVNAFDTTRPPPLEYSPNRIPMNGVNINTDPEFMSCCDCEDECVDKSKCACFQLTIRGAKYKNLMEEDEENISYLWKRLLAVVPTGIYECNSRCKCSNRCLNKVVQQPVRVKMQLYRTKARGWGLQSLHDIPKGTFICIYAGNLYTEKDANALCQGLDHGDEYFAELDLIENAENRKEGYESGVVNPDESEEEKDSDSDYDDKKDSNDYDDGDFVSKASKNVGQREILTRSSKTSIIDKSKEKKKSTKPAAAPAANTSASVSRQNSEQDSSDDELVNMIPNANNTGNLGYPEGMRIPFRKLYGPKEKVYIMDAKRCGNVGRYFNHSCDPNLFVQSVFVDTHDLRFPWIAFFSQRPIKAGEELTWNYNYEVGSVPSKVLYCKCGSKNCRGRIL